VSWEEVANPDLRADSYTLRTMPDRLAWLSKAGDPWAGMTRHRYDAGAARRRLAEAVSG
jgi:DNA primase